MLFLPKKKRLLPGSLFGGARCGFRETIHGKKGSGLGHMQRSPPRPDMAPARGASDDPHRVTGKKRRKEVTPNDLSIQSEGSEWVSTLQSTNGDPY